LKIKEKNKVRVLILAQTLSGGGVERFVSTLLNNINSNTFECTLALFWERITYPIPNRIPVHILGNTKGIKKTRVIKKLINLIHENEYDIILSSIWHTSMILGEAIPFIKYRPFTIAWFVSNPQQARYDQGINYLWAQRNYKRFDYFISVSSEMIRSINKCYPSTINKISCVHNPIDYQHIDHCMLFTDSNHLESDKLIISAGRLVPEKNFELLIKAFHKVGIRHKIKLAIIGEGPEKNELINLVNKLKISNFVDFYGYMDNPFPLYQKASIYAMSSNFEGFGISLAEAQGLGIPAISIDCDFGPREIIEDNVTGFLIPKNNEEMFSERMEELICNKELREKMGKSAKLRARKLFATYNIIPKIEKILLDSINYNQ